MTITSRRSVNRAMNDDEWITPLAAADQLACTRWTIYRLIERGDVIARNKAWPSAKRPTYEVLRSSVEELVTAKQTPA